MTTQRRQLLLDDREWGAVRVALAARLSHLERQRDNVQAQMSARAIAGAEADLVFGVLARVPGYQYKRSLKATKDAA